MRPIKLVSLSALTIICLGYAQISAAVDTMPTKTAYNWTGLSVGGQLGYGWSQINWDFFNGVNTERFNQSNNKGYGGAQIGYQHQCNHNLVPGLYVSYIDGLSNNSASSFSVINSNRTRRSNVSSILMVAPRLGYAHNRWLGYLKGGYVNARVRFNTYVTSTNQLTSTSSGRNSGFVIGAGADYGLPRNFTLGLEYDLVKLYVGNRNQNVTPTFTTPETASNINTYVNMLLAQFSYKFR